MRDYWVRPMRQIGGVSLYLTLPLEYLRMLDIKRGDYVRITLEGDTIVIAKDNHRPARRE